MSNEVRDVLIFNATWCDSLFPKDNVILKEHTSVIGGHGVRFSECVILNNRAVTPGVTEVVRKLTLCSHSHVAIVEE